VKEAQIGLMNNGIKHGAASQAVKRIFRIAWQGWQQ